MKNSEVVDMVEAVNAVLQNDYATLEELTAVQKWAQMGVETKGETSYRVLHSVISQLKATMTDQTKNLGEPEIVEAPEASMSGAWA